MNRSSLEVRKKLPLDCWLLGGRYQKGGGGSHRGQAREEGWGDGSVFGLGELHQAPPSQRAKCESSSNLVHKCVWQAAVPVPFG